MIHPKQHIVDLVEILAQKEISNIIISPGSRNAPLIEAFYTRLEEKCISIVDERSSGYVALGIGRNTNKPAVLLCTSGTAVLNYCPAVAEAYHQQIPIIVITADRPAEWVNQLDNQTLKQENAFSDSVKARYILPQNIVREDDLWFVHRIINETYNISITGPKGPVHLNIPLCEPLYEELPKLSQKIKSIESVDPGTKISLNEKQIYQWKIAEKILIVHGQDTPHSEVSIHLENLIKDPRVTVIAENISNVSFTDKIESPDLVLVNNEMHDLKPDLIIVSGLQVVSKRLKGFLRKAENMVTWRIGEENSIIDTYQQVDTVIKAKAGLVYKELGNYIAPTFKSDFQKRWLTAKLHAMDVREKLIKAIPFSDLKAFEIVFNSLPENVILELGNSSVIRYSQFFNSKIDLKYFSNRGVSGIDGCLSTGVGTALSTNQMVIAIVGDLSFVYDSNALWNKKLPYNLRIIVINNRGGGIFRLIDGPKKNTSFNEFVNAYHPVNFEKLAEAFDLNYFSADNENELLEVLSHFYGKSSKASILEIKTSAEVSEVIYKKILGN